MNCWRPRAAGLLLVALTLVAYAPALRGEFVWDDALLVAKNPLVTGEFNLRSVWFGTGFPLSLAALWLQWLAWGNHAAGYHVVNVLLHAANAMLLWRVLKKLNARGAWLAAAIFAVHPVGVASAAWISEMKNTLSLLFFLLSFRCYLNFDVLATERAGGKPNRWYFLALAAFLLALFSKPSTVMLPVVLLGWTWWRRGRIGVRDIALATPFFLLALGIGFLTITLHGHTLRGGDPVQAEHFAGRLAAAGTALWFYLGKALLPLRLNTIYPRWDFESPTVLSFLPALLWCAALALCWRFRRGWGRHALFALGAFTVLLFPVLGFFNMSFLALSRVSDHFQYLPLAALAALAGAGLSSARGARVFPFVRATLILALALLTFQRARIFASDERLWRDTLAKNPRAWTAENNLGCVFARQGKLADAIDCFSRSLALNPRNAGAHGNLGRALSLQGKFPEAGAHFETALAIKPADADIHASYAAALASQGNLDAAIAQLRAAIQLAPDVDSQLQLATLLYQTRKFSEAAAEYRRVLARRPDAPDALNNLAWLLATCSDANVRNGAEAVRFAEHACELTHYRQARTVGILAAAYAEAGRFADAATAATRAIELAKAAGDAQFAGMNEQLLQLYRAGQAYHE